MLCNTLTICTALSSAYPTQPMHEFVRPLHAVQTSWYLLMSKPRDEERALLNLQDQGYTVYLPRVLRERRKAGNRKSGVEPLFPRYLFVRLNEEMNWAPIRSTPGVSGLVAFGNRERSYIPCPDGMVEAIQAQENNQGLHQPQSLDFQKGDKVRITTGPFHDLEGVFLMDDGIDRALVLLHFLGNQRAVPVEAFRLSRVM